MPLTCFQKFIIRDFQVAQEIDKRIFMERVMLLLYCLIVKMPDICNLTGQNSVHISDIFTVQISMECVARKIEAGKK